MASSKQTRQTQSNKLTSQKLASVPLVVGIGASAGGPKALQAFFAALPAQPDMLFVVIVPLSPEHENTLAELLQPYTKMPIVQVVKRTYVENNHVYLIPSGKRLIAEDGYLDLAGFEKPRAKQAPIDLFFRALAEAHGDGVALILSGDGRDGSLGIKAIKERGGLLMAQEPQEAEFDGMPLSALATGLIDIVRPVQELAQELVTYQQSHEALHFPAATHATTEAGVYPVDEKELLRQILAYLRTRTGHDFSQYKWPTLLRRIERRMQVNHIVGLREYLRFLRLGGNEVEMLFRDMLISISAFFLDAEAFRALEEQVIPQLFARKQPGEAVRVWVVGCATGEEAYSLTILLLEQARRLDHAPEIQVFATDLDEQALDVARLGIYPETIAADVTDERIKRFFTKTNGYYQVKSEVRERVLFATHNLIKDPPFSRLDLLSCRNLLIYLQLALQEQLFELFSYALRPTGYLFLDNAESSDSLHDLFHPVDESHHIYQRLNQSGFQPQFSAPSLAALNVRRGVLEQAAALRGRNLKGEHHRRLLEAFAPPSMLIDARYNILHLSETAGRYLLHPGGPWMNDVTQLVRPELQFELRSALYQIFEQGNLVVTTPVWVQLNDEPRLVYMMVRSRYAEEGESLALVMFMEDEVAESSLSESEDVDAHLRLLEEELLQVQLHLQAMNSEHAASIQELSTANEELQSINEELEVSRKELHLNNEQSLAIVEESKAKIDEILLAHSNLQNLLSATGIATLLLDRNLCIKHYTPCAAHLFNIIPNDLDRPLVHLRAKIDYPWLEPDAQTVLKDLVTVEREVQSTEGLWYLLRMRPYCTPQDEINGVVLMLIDMTTRKQRQITALKTKEEAE